MKTVDTLAAIGVVTIVFVTVKTVLAIREVVYGPTKEKLKKTRKEGAT
jgi:hypothetical protein